MYYKGHSEEQLFISSITSFNVSELTAYSIEGLLILWNMEGEMVLNIDGVEYKLIPNQIVFLTEFHKVIVHTVGLVRLIRFNRSFYCIIDHDQEVGCRGLLFFGASQVPIVSVVEKELSKFEILWGMLSVEMNSRDNLQQEMLQVLLKRLIILSTRLYKSQFLLHDIEKGRLNLVREFNYLVEIHFRSKHSVSQYAELLNKSPKSLSNHFSQSGLKNPLQLIQDRILVEARRQLLYTDKIIKEIAYDIGFEDIQTFSRFFKTKEGVSPKEYRDIKLNNIIRKGNNANFLGASV